MYTRILTNKKRYKGKGRLYTQQALLLDMGGRESGCLEDKLGLLGVLAGQTVQLWCGPWQLAHL